MYGFTTHSVHCFQMQTLLAAGRYNTVTNTFTEGSDWRRTLSVNSPFFVDDVLITELFNDALQTTKSRDSSIGIALGYGLDDRGSRIPFPARAGNFSLHHRGQNGSEAHPASYPMGTKGSFPGDKAAGA
jgi:hypothetical protein